MTKIHDKELQVMVDIETLGHTSNSVICSIGAIIFSLKTGKIISKFYNVIDIQSCLDVGLCVTGPTIKWWLMQSDDARNNIIKEKNIYNIKDALHNFKDFLKNQNLYIWANAPSFDLVILRNAYKAIGEDIPWNFRNELDVRTLLYVSKLNKKLLKFSGVKHNALDDCSHQIKLCVKSIKKLNKNINEKQ